MKSNGVWGVGAGGACSPPKVLICWKKTYLKIWVKINGAGHCFISNRGSQCLHKNTWRPFLEVTPTNSDLCGREFVGKSCTKSFSGKFREIREKILRNTKNLPAPKPMMKSTSAPVAPLLKEQRVNAPVVSPSSDVPVHIGVARGGQRGHALRPKFLENVVILCFERRLSEQNSVFRLKSNIFLHHKFLGRLRHCLWILFYTHSVYSLL